MRSINEPSVANSVTKVTVDSNAQHRRLDNFLISLLSRVPKSHVYTLIRTGQVRVNSSRAKASRRLELGDVVRIPPVKQHTAVRSLVASAQLIDATKRVVHEDQWMLVLDKPAGVAVHSGTHHRLGLIEAFRQQRPDEKGIELVHRLDKDTSGLLVLAKNKRVLRDLHSLWRREADSSALTKNYTALLQGSWNSESTSISVESKTPLTKLNKRSQMYPKVAVSRFTVQERFTHSTLVDVELHTGKTHQARQHALQIGHPIAGDRKYGNFTFNAKMQELGLKRLFLHASKITLVHPNTQKLLCIESPLPEELTNFIQSISVS